MLEIPELLVDSAVLVDTEQVELTAAESAAAGNGESSKKRANELDGKTWTRYSISIWSDIRKTSEEIALKHPAMFPAELASRLIQIFTRQSDRVVFDPFAGIGSTIMAARQNKKVGIGIELSPEFADKARRRIEAGTLFDDPNDGSRIILGDSNNLLDWISPDSVDFVVTSPPYWDILTEKRSADYKETRHYGDEPDDLGKIEDYDDFLVALKAIFAKVFCVMRPGAYCCVIVMDIRKKSAFYPYHSDVASFMSEIGFVYDDLIVWDRRHEYNNMRPLGYPYVFRVNKAHEFILIFQKPKAREPEAAA